MKTASILSAIAAAVLLSSCGAPDGVSVQQQRVVKTGPAEPVHFQMSLKEPWRAPVSYGSREIAPGKSFKVEALRDFVYPAAYDPAAIEGNQAVSPATPKEFQTVKTGLVADLRSKRLGEWILIEGNISLTEFQGFSRTGGSLGRPVLDGKGRVLTENRMEMPKFAEYRTPVYLAIKSGESGSFEVSAPRKGTTATFSISAGN